MLPLLLAAFALAAPDTTIVSGPPAVTTNASPTFAFTATDPAAGFQCSLDDADFSACQSPFTAPALPAGVHTFAVRAVDAAGEADATPAIASFQLELPASAMLRARYAHDAKATRVKALTVRSVPAGGTVSATCRGRGCPFHAAKTFKAKHHVATLTGAFKHARLRSHARVEISVAAPQATTKLFRLEFRKPPLTPAVAILCLAPGATQPADCGST